MEQTLTEIYRTDVARVTAKFGQPNDLVPFINGQPDRSFAGTYFETLNPATGQPIARVADATADDVDRAVAAAREAFESGTWSRMRPSTRGQILVRIAAELRNNLEDLAIIECLDVGKPISQARHDIEATARYFEFYGGVADKHGGRTIPLADHLIDFTLLEPIGVSGQIIPFNYPAQNTGRGAGPALAVGCSVVLKPSPECPLTPLLIAQIASNCGVPDGVLNVVPGGVDAGRRLSGHPGINQVTFTGSVPTGIAVAKAAADNIVPTVLELGGKSPAIVFGDADFDLAVAGVSASIFSNAGQTCAAATRLLLEDTPEGDAFLAALVEKTRALVLGPGIDDADVGPVVSRRQQLRIRDYLDSVIKDGGRILVGGGTPENEGFFVEPTICEVPDNSARIAQEEVFGPVLTVIRFDTVAEAGRIANDTPYGLSSSVWTSDVNKALSLAKHIRAGQVNINAFNVGTGIEIPFGGYKASGWGREKGLETLTSYTQVKNVCIGIQSEFTA